MNDLMRDPAALAAAPLDPNQPTPLYHQLYLILRDRIRTGELARNTLLPGEQELTRLFNVSRITVKRALNELAADGLISRHRGRGSIVSAAPIMPVVRGSFFSLIESLKQMGLQTEVKLIEAGYVEAGPAIARLLELSPEDKVQRAVRLRSLNGEPFSYLLTFIPKPIASRYTARELAKVPLLTLLERVGAEVSEAEQWISAVAAEPAIATALDVPTSFPLLKIERVMRDRQGTPVQLVYAHYRSDRFQYHVKTTRRRGGNAAWRAHA
ncbi:MAG TPA: GntR family transcriptional regulator [Alphaproteobacteria bacterium]|nr:GntR family transcriptional regulator [Alphaproteobacteria bacterium]